jgi:hypothetical protein
LPSKARDAAARDLDHIDVLFAGVEGDFVGKGEAIGHDAELGVFVAGDVAVPEIGAEGVHPVPDLRGDRDPETVFGIAEDEVHFADGLAVDGIGEDLRMAVARHDFEAVGAEVGDEGVSVAGKVRPLGSVPRR